MAGSMTTDMFTMAEEFTTSALDVSSCLAVAIPVEQDSFTIDNLAVGIAFLVGLIVGALVAMLCAKLCIRDNSKARTQDAEEGYMNDNMIAAHDKNKLLSDESPSHGKKKGKKKRGFSAKKRGTAEEEDPLLEIVPVTVSSATESVVEKPSNVDDPEKVGTEHGLVHVLEKGGLGPAEEEVANQDMEAVSELERELKEEAIMSMVQVLRTLLGQQLKKGKVGKLEAQDIMKELQDNIQAATARCQQEKEDKEKELRAKIKDPSKLQDALDKNHAQYIINLNTVMQQEKENTRRQLDKKTDLTDAEIDALLSQFANNMAHMEHNLGKERARMAANLEERLQRRRQRAALAAQDKELEEREVAHRQAVTDSILGDLTESGKMTDRERQELLKQHGDDVDRIHRKHAEEHDKQKLHLAERLKQNRAERQRHLAEKQRAQKEEFMQMSDKGTDSKDTVQRYHELLRQQREEREAANQDMDEDEAEEFGKLHKNISRQRGEELLDKQEEFHEKLQNKSQVSDADIDRIIRIHHQEMDEWERMKKDEKKKMKARLQEKLAQRQAKLDAEELKTNAEQESIKAEQDLTMKKLIDSQIQLSDEAKDKIMKEHHQNMSTINNQLQMSKLRQNKALEAKLAKRKTKVADLKKQQEDLRTSKKEMKEKEREKLEKQLADQIASEERQLEEDRSSAVNRLRERLAEETALALKEQERTMGESLARLEVGQARRQAIINKQNVTIKSLEDQLATRVDETADRTTNAQVDSLLKDHYNQVSQLEDQLQDVKGRQEQQLREKIQAKKLRKEREVEGKLEEEAAVEWQQAKQRGAGLATAILSQSMLETRHKTAMAQLEQEMSVEMQRQREQLHDELQIELQQELDEQKKGFLAQVAAIGQLSKAEVNDLVEGAVADTGGNEKQAKKLAKEMRIEMQRAKTSLQGEGHDPHSSLKRTGTGYGFENGGYEEEQRPRSGKPRPRSAFRE